MNKQCTYIYPDNNWENKTLNYDLTQFDWPKWVLETIQEIEPNVTDLTELHFANELCMLKTRQDLLKIKTYLEWGVPSMSKIKSG